MSRRRTPKSNFVEHAMARNLDRLADFEEFESQIAPALRKAVKDNKSAKEIYDLVTAHAAARMASIALTDTDKGRAMAALKDILDRAQGKASENKTVKLELENLPDDQLEARLQTLIAEEAEDTSPADDGEAQTH